MTDYVREVDVEFLSAADRGKLEQKEPNPEATAVQTSSSNAGPKLKGRNKKRSKVGYRDAIKVCSYIVQQKPCPYGDKCRYAHDATDYLSSKPPDIGEKCPNIEKRGSCQYGMTCRFASKDHVPVVQSADGEASRTSHPDEINGMSRELQRILRKRTFVFHKDAKTQKVESSSTNESNIKSDATEEELYPLVDLVINEDTG